jgi:putative transposase
MALGLKRYQRSGHLHFITFSCYRRQIYLGTTAARDLFEDALEKMRRRHGFHVVGYVVMPEHVHLLLSEPPETMLAKALPSVKVSVVRRRTESPFWQARYYDFNVFTEEKRVEKLNYMHWNPVRRGLVENPEDWRWSSHRHYLTGEERRVRMETAWRTHWKPA